MTNRHQMELRASDLESLQPEGDRAGDSARAVAVRHARRRWPRREIARLTEAHDACRWLCGGVQVDYHTLCDFQKDHGDALDELFSVSIAPLMAAGVVKLKQVAQNGVRVRQCRSRIVPAQGKARKRP